MRILLASLFIIFSSLSAGAVEFKFADPEKAAEILLSQDIYFDRLGPAEIAIRMGSETADKTAADLKAHYRANFTNWTEEDMAKYRAVFAAHQEQVDRIDHLLPETIWFIRSTNQVEGGLPHTQGNAIIIQDNVAVFTPFLFFHEVFHILTRIHPEKHEALYGLLDFKACKFEEPESMALTHLTNPDVPPTLNYYITLADGENEVDLAPYLFAAHPAFNPEVEGGFPGHFGFGLLELSIEGETCAPLMNDDGSPKLRNPGQTPAYFDAIGRNTGYIIHVEETLSDNFVFWLIGWDQEGEMPNPEIPEKIGAWIDAQK